MCVYVCVFINIYIYIIYAYPFSTFWCLVSLVSDNSTILGNKTNQEHYHWNDRLPKGTLSIAIAAVW